RLVRRFGLTAAVRWGTIACVASLALCALSGNFFLLSSARLVAGVGAAVCFVASGALAARIAQSRPERADFLLSLFYAGPGLGILVSGLAAPFLLTPFPANGGLADAAPVRFAIRPVLIYLAAYFLFGAGYIAYMTFMIAYVRDAGGGAVAQSAFWCLIGMSAFVTPWVWRRVLARNSGGISTAIILAVN